MFGTHKKIEELETEIYSLKTQIKGLRENTERSISILKDQVSQMAAGRKISPDSVQDGTVFGVIGGSDLDDHLRRNPKSVVVDVRTDMEWSAGHIETAKHIEVTTIESRMDEFKAYARDREIICICAGGGRSAAACEMLYQHGYKNVVNVEGGMTAYTGKRVTA